MHKIDTAAAFIKHNMRSRSPPSPDYEAEKPDKAVEERGLTL